MLKSIKTTEIINITKGSDFVNEDELIINKEMDDELSNGKGNEEV